MAIKQSRYIDTTSSILRDAIGGRNVSGLVFTKDAMLETVDTNNAIKKAYDGGKVITLTYTEVQDYFGQSADISAFATKYFSYIAPNGGVPRSLNIFKVGDSVKAKTAFDNAIKSSNNFMTFTFLGTDLQSVGEAGELGLLDVATANNALDNPFAMIVATTAANATATQTSLAKIPGVHIVVGADSYAAYMPMSFVASIDYEKANAAGDLFGKQFAGETAVVTDDSTADSYDAKHLNYIGLTQVNGTEFSFYQRGDNQDGTALGVYANEMWLRSEIARAWFNLLLNVQRVPANTDGVAMITNVINEIASNAIDNGVILSDKPLSAAQRALVTQYANGNTAAADDVQDTGYYLNVELRRVDNEYHAYFTLIYAKGDAIRKVVGSNVLV